MNLLDRHRVYLRYRRGFGLLNLGRLRRYGDVSEFRRRYVGIIEGVFKVAVRLGSIELIALLLLNLHLGYNSLFFIKHILIFHKIRIPLPALNLVFILEFRCQLSVLLTYITLFINMTCTPKADVPILSQKIVRNILDQVLVLV